MKLNPNFYTFRRGKINIKIPPYSIITGIAPINHRRKRNRHGTDQGVRTEWAALTSYFPSEDAIKYKAYEWCATLYFFRFRFSVLKWRMSQRPNKDAPLRNDDPL